MARETTTVDLGLSDVLWSDEPVRVLADLALRDDLNPADREVQTIDHRTVRYGDVPFVSITWTYGTVAEVRRGDGSGGAGIDEAVVDGLDEHREKARRIVALADRWHLNTMRAGCAHQTVEYETGPYGRRPSLERTKPCPETGYRYGSAWLVEVPPVEVLAELRALFGLSAQCYSDHDEDIRTKGSCDYCGGTETVG